MDMQKVGAISNLAYDMGRQIEKFIHNSVDNIQETNRDLQAKILGFRGVLSITNPEFLEVYDFYFNIKKL